MGVLECSHCSDRKPVHEMDDAELGDPELRNEESRDPELGLQPTRGMGSGKSGMNM